MEQSWAAFTSLSQMAQISACSAHAAWWTLEHSKMVVPCWSTEQQPVPASDIEVRNDPSQKTLQEWSKDVLLPCSSGENVGGGMSSGSWGWESLLSKDDTTLNQMVRGWEWRLLYLISLLFFQMNKNYVEKQLKKRHAFPYSPPQGIHH